MTKHLYPNSSRVFDTSGKKECIGFFVQVASDTNVSTNFSPFDTQTIESLTFSIGNQDVYKHYNSQMAKFLLLQENGSTPFNWYGSDTNPIYFIPFKNTHLEASYVTKGNPGVNLSRVQPSININTSSGTTGTYWIYLSSMNKSTF